MKRKSQTNVCNAYSLVSALFLIFFQINASLAQREIPENNLAYPVLIELKPGIFGSGFYLVDGGHLYLVTAGHVLFQNTKHTLKSEAITLSSRPEDVKEKGLNIYDVKLKSLLDVGKVRYDTTYDVALVQLAKFVKWKKDTTKLQLKFNSFVNSKQPTKSGIVALESSNIKSLDEVLDANDIFVFGYPVSIGIKQIPQIDYSLPLLRKGIVAGKNQKLKTIILDCRVDKGNSGGPVLQVEKSPTKTTFRVIGIVTQLIPSVEISVSSTGDRTTRFANSGYSVAVSIEVVIDLLKDF